MSDLDTGRLEEVLRAEIGEDAHCEHLERSALGNGQEIWFLTVGRAGASEELVLRRSAGGGSLASTDRVAEFSVLRALEGRGLPVPGVRWCEGAGSRLGRPYFVMERMPGSPRVAPEHEAAVAEALGAALARLHAEDVDVEAMPRPPDAATGVRAELARWRDRYVADRLAPVAALGALLAWLEANVPDDGATAVLTWGDAGPHNLLAEGPQLRALLDWELAHYGHPLEDLGAALWALRSPGARAHLVAGYERAAGAPADRRLLDYFVALACATRSVMLVSGVADFVLGEAPNPNLAGLGIDLLYANLTRGLRLAGFPAGRIDATAPEVPATPPGGRVRPDVSETATGVAAVLRGEVLPATTSPHLARRLKSAVALLESAARRASDEARVEDSIAAARAVLAAELGLGADALDEGSIESLAIGLESRREGADPSRVLVREHLAGCVEARRSLATPLRALYGSPDD